MNGRTDGRSCSPADRVLVCNPVSGSADHAAEIRTRASERGFDVRETEAAGDAARLAREAAAEGASLVAVAGGDGTVNEVVHGLVEADALETVAVAVLPTGTANLFARSLGIDDVDRGFELLDRGETRRIDVGFADGRPFVNTCLAGISAEANTATPGELKRRLGPLAYVLTTLRLLPEYDGIPLRVRLERDVPGAEPTTESWCGDALLVLVGNAFRLPSVRRRDRPGFADGLLEVTILEERPDPETLEEGRLSRLLEGDVSPVTRLEASALSIEGRDGALAFSLDGESLSTTALELRVRERCLSVFVDEPPDGAVLG